MQGLIQTRTTFVRMDLRALTLFEYSVVKMNLVMNSASLTSAHEK